jgi:carbonic anhydrase/acetyltransferase-like protein (isoleucine patch superfamily)
MVNGWLQLRGGEAKVLYSLDGKQPVLVDAASSWVAPTADVIGDVIIGAGCGIWFGAVLRGDTEPITIGDNTNVQENCVVHTDPGCPVNVGRGCTIGHKALLHGCTIGDNTLVGMGAIILNHAVIGANCLVGAGALVTERKQFPDGSLIVGVPAKVVRALSDDEIAGLRRSAEHYVSNQQRFAKGLVAL